MKTIGNYTLDAAKILKKSNKIYCQIDKETEKIYVSNGYLIFCMSKEEYSTVVQTVTKCDPNDWIIRNGERCSLTVNVKSMFDKMVEAAGGDLTSLQRCPLEVQDNKDTFTALYSTSSNSISFFNKIYITAFAPSCTFHFTDKLAAIVKSTSTSKIIGVIMPWKSSEKNKRAVAAWFTEPADEHGKSQAEQADVAELKSKIAEQAAMLEKLRAEQADVAELKSAAEIIAARFAELDGIKPVIKGATTSAPIVWLSGKTEKHADAIRAAGAKWSGKRNAYYIRVI